MEVTELKRIEMLVQQQNGDFWGCDIKQPTIDPQPYEAWFENNDVAILFLKGPIIFVIAESVKIKWSLDERWISAIIQ